MIPSRSGLTPTLLILTFEFGIIRAATIIKAADDISPGIIKSLALNSCPL